MHKRWDVILNLDFIEILRDSEKEEDYVRKIRRAREEVEKYHSDILSITPALTDAFNHLTNPKERCKFFICKSVERCFQEWNITNHSVERQSLTRNLEKKIVFLEFNELKGDAFSKIKKTIFVMEKPPVMYKDWPLIEPETYQRLISQDNVQVKELMDNKVEILFPNSGQECYIPGLKGDLVYRCTIKGLIKKTAPISSNNCSPNLNHLNVFKTLFKRLMDEYPNITSEDYDMYYNFFKNDINTLIDINPYKTVDEVVNNCMELFKIKLKGLKMM